MAEAKAPFALPKEDRARYKLEVHFGRDRTANGPNVHLILAWDTEGPMASEGDALMGFCPICPEQIVPRPMPEIGEPTPTTGYCPVCKAPFPLPKMADWLTLKTTTRALAERLEKLAMQLGGNVDVILKFARVDIRYDPKDFSQSRLEKARRSVHKVIYTLRRISQDLSGGANLADLLEAYLKA